MKTPTHRKGRLLRLFRKQKGRCYICGEPMALRTGRDDTATIEHLIPKSRTVVDYAHKYKAACYSCNQKKGSRTEIELER